MLDEKKLDKEKIAELKSKWLSNWQGERATRWAENKWIWVEEAIEKRILIYPKCVRAYLEGVMIGALNYEINTREINKRII